MTTYFCIFQVFVWSASVLYQTVTAGDPLMHIATLIGWLFALTAQMKLDRRAEDGGA
jgi:hypothetical protein